MKDYNTLDDFELQNKTVLLRVDFNMPLDKETLDIIDNTRIERALPTIKELIENNAKTVILAHQGRQGSWDYTSLEKHAKALEKLLHKDVKFVDDVFGEKAKNAIKNLKNRGVLFLDNVRKFDGETEKKSAEVEVKFEKTSSVDGIEVYKAFATGLNVKGATQKASEFISKKKNALVILVNVTDDKSNIVVASNSDIDAKEVCAKLSSTLGGGAGGTARLSVGGGSAKNAEKVLEKLSI